MNPPRPALHALPTIRPSRELDRTRSSLARILQAFRRLRTSQLDQAEQVGRIAVDAAEASKAAARAVASVAVLHELVGEPGNPDIVEAAGKRALTSEEREECTGTGLAGEVTALRIEIAEFRRKAGTRQIAAGMATGAATALISAFADNPHIVRALLGG